MDEAITEPAQLAIFGEALFDCFEDGQQIPGGAPFNVAWHLHALGDAPTLISRVGEDVLGRKIRLMMLQWDMPDAAVQDDPEHPTGEVGITMNGGEPQYTIRENAAWDFIDHAALPELAEGALLYHGTLALRSLKSRNALLHLLERPDISVYLDINLRAPWWNKESTFAWLERARWGKLNQHEMAELGFRSDDIRNDMEAMQTRFRLEQLIVTFGAEGAIVRCNDGRFIQRPAPKPGTVVDSVGAGDAFSAMYLHGLRAGWPVAQALDKAQQFACAVLGQRGAIVRDPGFYEPFRQS